MLILLINPRPSKGATGLAGHNLGYEARMNTGVFSDHSE
jgi:hypothetical protein